MRTTAWLVDMLSIGGLRVWYHQGRTESRFSAVTWKTCSAKIQLWRGSTLWSIIRVQRRTMFLLANQRKTHIWPLVKTRGWRRRSRLNAESTILSPQMQPNFTTYIRTTWMITIKHRTNGRGRNTRYRIKHAFYSMPISRNTRRRIYTITLGESKIKSELIRSRSVHEHASRKREYPVKSAWSTLILV